MRHLVLTLVSVFVFVSCGNNKSITETDPETGIKYEKIKDEYNVPHKKLNGQYYTIAEVNKIIDYQQYFKVRGKDLIKELNLKGVIDYESNPGELPEMPYHVIGRWTDKEGNTTQILVKNKVTGNKITFFNYNETKDALRNYFPEKMLRDMFKEFNDYDIGDEFMAKSASIGNLNYFPITDDVYKELLKGLRR